jgi:uncharacterized protein (DUF488 family)
MANGPFFTIGHSTRSLDELISLLAAHHVTQLADVRTVPRSRRHPHFAIESLSATLPPAGITYRHFAGLGGLRRPRPDSTNVGWHHPAFRGYADHMGTAEFAAALDDLTAWAQTAATAVMCAEAVWWKCHRRLIADALVARGLEVRHIMTAAPPERHEVTAFARVSGGQVTYPGLI